MTDIHRPPFPVDAPLLYTRTPPRRSRLTTALRAVLWLAFLTGLALGVLGAVDHTVKAWLHEAARAVSEVR